MVVKDIYLRQTASMVIFFFCQVQVLPLATGVIQKRSACGGNIVAESGFIQSPNFPRNYGHMLQCNWVITVPEDSLVKLTFDEFQLEESDVCSYDYVEVCDGPSTGSKRLGIYCGIKIPSPIQSSNNTITVMFISDGSGTDEGFSAQFTKVLPLSTGAIPDQSACGGNIVAESGIVQSPNFPRDYEPNLKCTWVITVPEGSVVTLRFNEFELEDSDACSKDSVEVYDGSSTRSYGLGVYCGSGIPSPIHSSNNTINVIFITDGSNNKKGFSAQFTTDACGGNIVAESGLIQSPNFPGYYESNVLCTWVIRVPENNIVKLFFVEFDLEISDACSYDYVEVYDGPSTRSHRFGVYCGFTIPSPIQSSGNTITVNFITDGSDNKKGFNAQFTGVTPLATGIIIGQSECGGNIVAESGVIQSPNFPENYGYNQQCTWVITVPENNIVNLMFDEFELEESDTCSYDSVEVYNGSSTRSNSLGVYCGSGSPSPIQSSSKTITVIFISDGSYNSKGFSAEFTKGEALPLTTVVVPEQRPVLPSTRGVIQEPRQALPLTTVIVPEKESKEHLTLGFIALIAIGVAGVLIIAAVVLYYLYPSERTISADKVLFIKRKITVP